MLQNLPDLSVTDEEAHVCAFTVLDVVNLFYRPLLVSSILTVYDYYDFFSNGETKFN